MTLSQILSEIVVNTFSGIIINSPWFFLIYYGFKLVAKEIRAGVQQMPLWIEQYEKIKEKSRKIDWASNRK